mmetsp:Transcript_2429/g.6384  ORF Transcript_2429/g.6384 Transcript_2429/m.6384 type:complete len:221 (-) Transcript_2429:1772-2434(-)
MPRKQKRKHAAQKRPHTLRPEQSKEGRPRNSPAPPCPGVCALYPPHAHDHSHTACTYISILSLRGSVPPDVLPTERSSPLPRLRRRPSSSSRGHNNPGGGNFADAPRKARVRGGGRRRGSDGGFDIARGPGLDDARRAVRGMMTGRRAPVRRMHAMVDGWRAAAMTSRSFLAAVELVGSVFRQLREDGGGAGTGADFVGPGCNDVAGSRRVRRRLFDGGR